MGFLWLLAIEGQIIDGKGVVMEKSKLEDNLRKFKKGDKVKTKYGEIRTVLFQKANQVFVEEESNQWYQPSNLFKQEWRTLESILKIPVLTNKTIYRPAHNSI